MHIGGFAKQCCQASEKSFITSASTVSKPRIQILAQIPYVLHRLSLNFGIRMPEPFLDGFDNAGMLNAHLDHCGEGVPPCLRVSIINKRDPLAEHFSFICRLCSFTVART